MSVGLSSLERSSVSKIFDSSPIQIRRYMYNDGVKKKTKNYVLGFISNTVLQSFYITIVVLVHISIFSLEWSALMLTYRFTPLIIGMALKATTLQRTRLKCYRTEVVVGNEQEGDSTHAMSRVNGVDAVTPSSSVVHMDQATSRGR
ncbi:hypothetical protein L1987_86244 [Smallanthus sonchifolius]|uniref:Uncharacterized protein n=1 Tax=Smallanthus sonchifolius TaxID=185202 RepID=A0ACB8XYS6_9ASTR|nr:hypothetical protein L1987_86244 [Smallanthus sonchifolius]